MSRFAVLWFILVIASGVTNFLVKQNVQNLDDRLASIRNQTVAEQKKIHELTADWTFLNQPELLTELNNRYVHLGQLSPKQVVANLDAIPLRLTPTPPAQDAVVPQVAEAAPVMQPEPQVAQAVDPIVKPAPAASSPAAPVAQAPIVPVSATTTTPVRPAAAATPTRAPAATTQPASLDALFAQVSEGR